MKKFTFGILDTVVFLSNSVAVFAQDSQVNNNQNQKIK